jgi:hypothetical protein
MGKGGILFGWIIVCLKENNLIYLVNHAEHGFLIV